MAIVQIDDVGKYGIIADTPPHELPLSAWSAGQNVRFNDNKIEKIQGQKAVFGTPLEEPHTLFGWQRQSEYRWIYAGPTKIYYATASTHTDITRYNTTPGDNDYTAGSRPVWTGGMLGGIPVLNNAGGVDYPQQWDETLSRMKDLTNWPANTYAKVMRVFLNFLIALDITDNGVNYPYRIKWSHPADPGSVPPSWNPADPSYLAGETDLMQSGGRLIDCLPLGQNNIIYKEDAIWIQVLADTQNVFSFREASQTIGALSQRCIQEFYRQHLVVGQNDIVLFDGMRPRSIISKRLRKWFFGLLSGEFYGQTQVTVNYPKREIWVCFVEEGAPSGYLTKALVWNWESDTWSIKELADLAVVTYGQVTTANNSFDASSGSFDSDSGFFGSAIGSPAEYQLLAGKVYGGLSLEHLDEGYDNDGTAFTSFIERTGLTLTGQSESGVPATNPASVKFLRRVYPKVAANTSGITLNVYVGAQDYIEGPITWQGPYEFRVNQDRYIDCAISGRYLAVKFEDVGNMPWALTGYSLDIDEISRL